MLDFQGVFCMSRFYYVLMTAIGMSCIYLGWDSSDGVPLFQLALIFGGAVIGHVLTETLNQPEE